MAYKGKLVQWTMAKELMNKLFNKAVAQTGKLHVYTALEHKTESASYISAYVVVDGMIECIAKQKRVSGGGMDMGFALAYGLTQDYCENDLAKLQHHWL